MKETFAIDTLRSLCLPGIPFWYVSHQGLRCGQVHWHHLITAQQRSYLGDAKTLTEILHIRLTGGGKNHSFSLNQSTFFKPKDSWLWKEPFLITISMLTVNMTFFKPTDKSHSLSINHWNLFWKAHPCTHSLSQGTGTAKRNAGHIKKSLCSLSKLRMLSALCV